MKKIFLYILAVLFIIIILPSICTKRRQDVAKKEDEKQEQNVAQVEKYDYSKYKDIRLFHSKTGEVEVLPFDEYLYGVVSSEMPVSYEVEALKAQAIVARTYTLYQIINSNSKHENADICDDYACCQAWISKEDRMAKWKEDEAKANWEKIVNAVDLSKGKIITYSGKPIDAFFHSNSGGKTENVSNVWGGSDLPYLKSVETAGEEGYTQYSSEVKLTKEELINKIKNKYSDFDIDFNQEDCIKILEYTESGRVRTIKIGNKNIAGTEARTIFGLKSTHFEVSFDENNVCFSVIGYGHGVGMSQTGADVLAKSRKYGRRYY